MRLLLLRTWLTNIGNGFIDMGAKASLERAYPDAEIVTASGFGAYTGYHRRLGIFSGIQGLSDQVADLAERRRTPRKHDALNISNLVDCDVAVLPGCTLYPGALEPYRETLRDLSDRGIPIVLLGAGGMDYSPETRRYVRDVLEEVGIEGMITRDIRALEAYDGLVHEARDGIDCAFFIDDYYTPPRADREFDVHLFDKINEPRIGSPRTVVRPDHSPFGYAKPYKGLVKQAWSTLTDTGPQDNEFRSDVIEDYLFLYANATETHADRIHACVPALVYGNRARFYYETPRALLFEQFHDLDTRSNLVELSDKQLQERKRTQVADIQAVVDSVR